jgi:hypothetical protein
MEWVDTLRNRKDRKIWLLVVHLEIDMKTIVLNLSRSSNKERELKKINGLKRFQDFSAMILQLSNLKAQSSSKRAKNKDLRNST